MTYTYALLAVSQQTFDEISEALRKADHEQALSETDDRLYIDMNGLTIYVEPTPVNKDQLSLLPEETANSSAPTCSGDHHTIDCYLGHSVCYELLPENEPETLLKTKDLEPVWKPRLPVFSNSISGKITVGVDWAETPDSQSAACIVNGDRVLFSGTVEGAAEYLATLNNGLEALKRGKAELLILDDPYNTEKGGEPT